MTDPLLKELDVTDFRSIRGNVHAPLDAQVVLVHGENGAGKTSLLSAIELALTGGVQSLRRADPGYATQLVHRSADLGSVSVTTAGDAPARYHATLSSRGVTSVSTLDGPRAAFFSERSYLPQALLGQLLQIYQESGGGAGSPLAQFVGELLRLDRLDAMEAGLKPLGDVRNVRKLVDGWSDVEFDKSRIDALVKDRKDGLARIAADIGVQMAVIRDAAAALDAPPEPDDRRLDAIEVGLGADEDERTLATVVDSRRRLASIRREIDAAAKTGPVAASPADPMPGAFSLWEAENGARYAGLRTRIAALLPEADLPADMGAFADGALQELAMRAERATVRSAKAKADAERLEAAREEGGVARSRLGAIDAEMVGIPASSGGLAALLAELASSIDGDTCPVCDRDYAQVPGGDLVEHVHAKVRRLSSSAQRLLELGRTRTEAQTQADRLDREIASLEQVASDDRTLAGLDREAAELDAARSELGGMIDALREGARLRAAEVATRRAVTEAQSRSVALTAARQTLSEFARSIAAHPVAEGEDPATAGLRLQLLLDGESKRLEGRLAARRAGMDAVTRIRALHARRDGISRDLAGDERALAGLSEAQRRAQMVRTQATRIRDAVDVIRSAMIRREFNERLNRLWRDLFVRLAPAEPFIPAFRIPDAATQRIQPQLVTVHRDGGTPGGAPGAMLSAGNLNTAALTLFLALHLSVPGTLPWLILDDPVQSMDDVHIAHFAALLRTLAKEHERQIIVAVHDRRLFEYLRLELSPAFPTDSLLTLELTRRQRQDTRCLARRFGYHEENSLVAA